VHLIEESMAAAIGTGLAIDEPRANMVVDVGGGTSEVAVISLGGIVVSRSLRVGGYDMDDAVAAWLRGTHGLTIGETTAERVKLEVGSVVPDRSDGSTQVKGRDPISGLPRQVDVTSEEMRKALESSVAEIVVAVKAALEDTPPELASDIPQRGIVLAGGGALLRGLGERLQDETSVPVQMTDSPLTCVALGAGMALDEIELLERASTGAGGAGSRRR
jgi:rod shape-determining protein MreB